jgi:Flp pilus assembly protein TadG
MRARLHAARGSVSVEFAAVLPLVAVSMLLVAQIALLVSEQLAVQHAAREGARAAAVWNDDDRARTAALDAGNLDASRTTITISPSSREVGTPVRVEIRFRPVEMPIVGRFMPSTTTLSATVEMRTERAPPDGS